MVDIRRLEKQGWKNAESLGIGSVAKKENPLSGVVNGQKQRNTKAKDILDIGSGTRCKHCGLLHFCWVERCGACSKPMEYNLGKKDVKQ